MRPARFGVLLFLLLLSVPAWSQQSSPPSITAQSVAQAVVLMQQSLAAQTGSTALNDVTLSGTFTQTRNSVAQSGTFVFTIVGGEQSQITATLPSGTHSEIRSITNGVASGVATGEDGVSHTLPVLSAWVPHPSWLFPAMILSKAITSSSYGGADQGLETRNGLQVRHLSIWQIPPVASSTPAKFGPPIAQIDLYLDPTSLLPMSMVFSLHAFLQSNPDKTLFPYRGHSLDRSEEVDFSNYQKVGGCMVAFHVQVFQKNVLVYDIQLSSVAINTGAVIASSN